MKNTIFALFFALFIVGAFVIIVKLPEPEVVQNHEAVKRSAEEMILDTLPTHHQPALLVKKNEDDTCSIPLAIKTVKMDVKTVGNMAQTEMELVFYNHIGRDLEGEFVFPLGEGQILTGYALEVNGKMRKGVAVKKEEGRKIFEEVIRQGIDPGLLEWTRGNVFRTRIFPIPAKGTKRIRVTIVQQLISTDTTFQYTMPLEFEKAVDQFTVNAQVHKNVKKPYFDDSTSTVLFKEKKHTWNAGFESLNYLANIPVRLTIPKNEDYKNLCIDRSQFERSLTFYYTSDPVHEKQAKQIPSTVCLLWDVSGSGYKRNVEREILLLENYCNKNQNSKVQLVTFNNAVTTEKEFDLAKGEWTALKSILKESFMDGGTQLGALDLNKYKCDEFILCSDGISSFGSHEIKLSQTPVICIASSQEADYTNLKRIARETGGRFINLLNETDEEALTQIKNNPFRFINAQVIKGEVDEMYPGIATDINKTFSFSGKVTSGFAEIVLNYGYGTNITHSERITIGADMTYTDGMIENLWALKKINELEVEHEKNKEELTNTGLKYGLVTRYTSLLVLDRIEDYVRYNIVPVEPALQDEYFALKRQQELEQKQYENEMDPAEETVSHIDQVVEAFNRRVEWWKTDYKPHTLKKLEKRKDESDEVVYDEGYLSYSSAADSTAVEATEEAPAEEEPVAHNLSFSSGLTAPPKQEMQKFSPLNNESNEPDEVVGKIKLKEFNPDMPYLKKLNKASKKEWNSVYRNLRKQYATSPTFFIDVSEFFFKKGQHAKAITVLSNLAEMYPENHQVLRVMAHRLQQAKQMNLAIATFKEVLAIREEEPQSYRDLGLAYAENKQYQNAVDMLCKVINRNWDGRFPNVEVLVAGEVNTILAKCPHKLKLDSLDKRLIYHLPVDVRVVINWDNDNCDMDLWVTDPLNETCMYNHNMTRAGGMISTDFTGGYGPEEFLVKQAVNGKYLIQVNYYGSTQQTVTGPTTVQAELYTNYGKPNEVKQEITLRLNETQEVIDIGELVFTTSKKKK